MYCTYRSHFTPSYSYSYPSYGYGSLYGYGYGNSGSYYSSYYRSRSRRRKNYWDRYTDMCNRWRRNRRDRRSPSPPKPETPPLPTIPEVPTEELVKELHVKDVDLHIKENTEKHRTDEYACTKDRKVDGKPESAELVVRRGDTIKMTITFDRPYSKEKNDLKLCFSLGKNPKPSRGTQVVFDIDESGTKKFKPDKWGATLQSKSGNNATILVHIPANCIIGEWNFYVKTFSEGKDKEGKEKTLIRQFEPDDDIIILFNPWCKEDGVYMATEKLLDEYICNESGAVWRGNGYQIGAKPWNFGQFGEGILDICLLLVTSGFDDDRLKHMSDPVRVSRMIAKMVNSSDDNGVLTGNWSGDYTGGTPPGKWAGSYKILTQWRESGPVKFGQCWVFSCVTTTVCRALGIPCRTVTNFSSAHDTDQTNCIEKFFQRIGNEDEPIDHLNNDSVWNFHVWNEVWMARPDLKPSFPYGWQVIDATPQETSEGVYTCGPCPVAAVRKGLCMTNYDTAFVFSEVNADKVHWRVHSGDRLERIELFKHSVGKKISTKTPTGKPFSYRRIPNGKRDDHAEANRDDVTLAYKPAEGTEEERETVMQAHRTARFPVPETYKEKEKIKPVEFHLNHDNSVMIGGKMLVELTAKNNGRYERKIPVVAITAFPQGYTGNYGEMFHRKHFMGGATLKPGEEKSFGTVMDPEEYLDKLKEQASISIVATAYVEGIDDEEEQTLRKEHTVRFRRPDLEVEGPDEVRNGDCATFVVSFTNPLDRPLTACNMSMESAGFVDLDDLRCLDVQPKGEFRQEFRLDAIKPKKTAAVYFSFDCKEIPDISGSTDIRIT
ncbi:hemocyte protein-glutamine gamma-glutamyltransferase-like [Mercenaria mercenaria]|uniref:hemocyte protein-glutamine gamma-glutamyltransferase-like n=1 Tax=Mercenaria mercenaria TaxID=6596 RepID=UPI00234F693C|nr:hemocyte protein-glutamine gamma-glutamyltransferase-like [Mercenaria mercenaria]XP_045192045.2 hemocyte protein-glutamine gamma-glutamyltransferase-like [Mercenaria mercenaria]